MALNFSHLVAETDLVPAGAIEYDATASDIVIKVGALIGESLADINAEKVVEFASRLMEAARAAQLTYNNNGGTPLALAAQVNSFNAGTYGAVQTTSAGDQIVVFSQTMTSRIPLTPADRSDNLGAL